MLVGKQNQGEAALAVTTWVVAAVSASDASLHHPSVQVCQSAGYSKLAVAPAATPSTS